MMIIPPATAGEEALKTVRRLEASPRWRSALSGAAPRRPLLVQRTDRQDSYYYIVEYRRSGVPTARIIVDATTGRYLEAKGVERVGASLSPFREPPAHAPAAGGHAADGQPVPDLYWRPCRESTTPFKPFYRQSLGGDFLYIRVDGEQFTKLTDGPV